MKLDLAELTGVPVSDILLDCIMYEDDDLFEDSLKLLDRRFGQRRKLLQALDEVYLLDDGNIPTFTTVSNLQSRLGTLVFAVRSTSSWCVKSVVSGDFDEERFTEVQEFCGDLVSFLSTQDKGGRSYKVLDLDAIIDASETAADPDVRPGQASPRQQNILRTMQDLYTVLAHSFNIDINIAFRGSKCTIHE